MNCCKPFSLSPSRWRALDNVNSLENALDRSAQENKGLKEMVRDYGRIRKAIGEDQVDSILEQVKAKEQDEKQALYHRSYER